MNGLEVFLCTHIEKRGRIKDFISWGCGFDIEGIADKILTPVRVLWGGHTVEIVRNLGGDLETIHSVVAYHSKGSDNVSRSNPSLHSLEKNWILTTLSIICLIPSVLIGAPLKMLAHLWEETRQNYRFATLHFTPTDIHVGTPDKPVTEQSEDLDFDTAERAHRLYNNPVENLIVHGKDLFLTARGRWIATIAPERILLEGTRLYRGEPPIWWKNIFVAGKDAVERAVDEGRELITGAFSELITTGMYRLEKTPPGSALCLVRV